MNKIDKTVFYRLERAIRVYRQFAQRQIRNAGYSITIDQWLAIKHIADDPEIKQNELAERIFKDNASVTRIIELLVKAGYLERQPFEEDRRRTRLIVTRTGHEVIGNVATVIESNRKAALKGTDDETLRIVDHFLQRLVENCERRP